MRFYPLQFRSFLFSLVSPQTVNKIVSDGDFQYAQKLACLPDEYIHAELYPKAAACGYLQRYIPTTEALIRQCYLLTANLLISAPSHIHFLWPFTTTEDEVTVLFLHGAEVCCIDHCFDEEPLKFGIRLKWSLPQLGPLRRLSEKQFKHQNLANEKFSFSDSDRKRLSELQTLLIENCVPSVDKTLYLFANSEVERNGWICKISESVNRVGLQAEQSPEPSLVRAENVPPDDHTSDADRNHAAEINDLKELLRKAEDELTLTQSQSRALKYEVAKLQMQLNCNREAIKQSRSQAGETDMLQLCEPVEHEKLCKLLVYYREAIGILESRIERVRGIGVTGGQRYEDSLHKYIERCARLTNIVKSLSEVFPSQLGSQIRHLAETVSNGDDAESTKEA